MPRGGARPGAGRPRKNVYLKQELIRATDQMPVETLAHVMKAVPRGAKALQAIQTLYDHPDTPVDVRLKLYALAVPFETAKPARAAPDAGAAPTSIVIATGVPRAANS